MFLSQLPAPAQQRVTVSKFSGYDARPRTALGAFRRMENLTGDGYPTLSVRGKRKTVTTLERPNALTAKDCLIWVEGSKRPPAVRWNPDADDLTSDAWEVTGDWYEP